MQDREMEIPPIKLSRTSLVHHLTVAAARYRAHAASVAAPDTAASFRLLATECDTLSEQIDCHEGARILLV